MDVKLTLPNEVLEALGPDPEREALEGVLLLLVGEDRLSLDQAGEILGLGGREEAARWYAGRVHARPDPTSPPEEIEEPVFLGHLTQEELDRSNRFLKITPAKEGSGFSDVSINHDKYLYGDA